MNERLKKFYETMQSKGYEVKELNLIFHNGKHTVIKNNFYYVSIPEEDIIQTPLEMISDYVEAEFERLQKEHNHEQKTEEETII